MLGLGGSSRVVTGLGVDIYICVYAIHLLTRKNNLVHFRDIVKDGG